MNHCTPILTLPLADCIERPRQSRDQRESKKRGSPKEADMRNQEMELMAHLMRRAGFGRVPELCGQFHWLQNRVKCLHLTTLWRGQGHGLASFFLPTRFIRSRVALRHVT